MTDVATNPAPSPATSTPLPLPGPSSLPTPLSLHAMSTRSSHVPPRQQQQQESGQASISRQDRDFHPLPGGRLARKRAQSINVEEANNARIEELNLRSPAFLGTPPLSATTGDHICICPPPPKVPRPRNAFILYRQHHQSGVVQKYPGLANPEISKIIGELWGKEPEEVKNSWKHLAEEEKARHQRQYPQYKYQPRRGGKGALGIGGRPPNSGGSSDGGDPGRCPKCHGRYITTPRTPSFPSQSGQGQGGSSSATPPFLTNNPRVIETVHQTNPRQSVDMSSSSQHGRGSGDPRRPSFYPPGGPLQFHEHGLRTIGEDYDNMSPALSKRRQPSGEDYDIMFPNEAKRRRYAEPNRSPERGPASAHPYPRTPSVSSPITYAQHGPGPRRTSNMGSGYVRTPCDSVFAPLPHPRMVVGGPNGLPRDMGMAPPPPPPPPPHPSRHFSTATAGGHPPAPPPPPGLPTPGASSAGYDESLTLAPLQIPTSPTQASDTSGARSLSGGGSAGLGIMSHHGQQRGDSQARGIEAMVMTIPYMNKLDVLRKISPPLGPPGLGSPVVETRGPVIAIEGAHAALMREVGRVIEKALRQSGECEVKVWRDSAAREAETSVEKTGDGAAKKDGEGEDVEKGDAQQDKTDKKTRSQSVGDAGSHWTSDYFQTIIEWHAKSAEIINHVTPKASTSTSTPSSKPLLPVALIPDGFSLTLSDKFASTVAITDPYSPVDHWQWMATLWRGIVGADLVVCVREATRSEGSVEYRAQGVMGVMVVRVGEKGMDEKTARRLAFEVMEWVRAGSFREGYALGGSD